MTTATTQQAKGERLAHLHAGPGAFVIPNPWDAGTARLLERLGFEALATTSSGFAFSRGRQDDPPERDEMLDHVRTIVEATSLPVSADLQHGYGDAPETVAETIRAAAAVGAVGGSIEDRPYRAHVDAELFEIDIAAARIAAAARAARGLSFEFVLTARCENYLCGMPDLDDTIRRLQAYAEAGADVLYAPGLTEPDEIRAVVTAVDRPVNFVAGLAGEPFPVAELERFGVRRISLGSALSRTAIGAFVAAAHEIRTAGTFAFVADAIAYERIDQLLEA
jgi:2-methylisocitrate lyase-like PEP mutase family enzyme